MSSTAGVLASLCDADLAKLRRRIERLVDGDGLPSTTTFRRPTSKATSRKLCCTTSAPTGCRRSSRYAHATQTRGRRLTICRQRWKGPGGIDWNATQLSPLDLDAFGRRIEAPDAGGILQEVDGQCLPDRGQRGLDRARSRLDRCRGGRGVAGRGGNGATAAAPRGAGVSLARRYRLDAAGCPAHVIESDGLRWVVASDS